MANIDAFRAANNEELVAFTQELFADPGRVTALVRELNERPGESDSIGVAIDLGNNLHRLSSVVSEGFSGIESALDMVGELALSGTYEFDLAVVSNGVDPVIGPVSHLDLGPEFTGVVLNLYVVKILVAIAYAMGQARTHSHVAVMSGKAERVHRTLVNVTEHPDLERHLAEALRQLDIADELVNDIARSNAAALETFTSLLPVLIEAAKGTVAAGEPSSAADFSRRGFLAAASGIAATGVVTYSITKKSTDRQVESSTDDTQKIVDAIEATEAQEATIEHLAAALERALEALETACMDPVT